MSNLAEDIKTIIYNETELFGEKEMRWYQIAAKNGTIQAIVQGFKRIMIVLPTGSGKTITVAATLNTYEIRTALGITEDRKLRVLFVSHLQRLLTQADEAFSAEFGVELILQSAFSPIPQIIIDQGFDIVVLDECQHEAMATLQYQLDTTMGDKVMIGLTATPDRHDGFLIKFDKIINPISREEAVLQGYLAETRLYSVCDGSEKSKTQIICDIVDQFGSIMGGTLIFVRTKKEIQEVHDYVTSLGYKSVAILNQKPKELNRILDDFSAGNIDFIISANKLGEGVDIKKCRCVLIGRTLGSLGLLNQYIGRSSRPDCDSIVFEIINPLSANNLDSTAVIGTPQQHTLCFFEKGEWIMQDFDYTS